MISRTFRRIRDHISARNGVVDMDNKKKSRKARVDRSLCVACGCCVKVCSLGAITVYRGLYAKVDENRCVGCGRCAKECPATVIAIAEVMA